MRKLLSASAVEQMKRFEAENHSLRQMVQALSAIIDLQELPAAITLEDYRDLLRGKPLKLRRSARVKAYSVKP